MTSGRGAETNDVVFYPSFSFFNLCWVGNWKKGKNATRAWDELSIYLGTYQLLFVPVLWPGV
ncbi:hypothetical protein V8C42DRAFT_322626, partial [Trichoderma barbatum]